MNEAKKRKDTYEEGLMSEEEIQDFFERQMKHFGVEIRYMKDLVNIFEQGSCPVCFEEFEPKEKQKVGMLPCYHILHKECLNRLVYKDFNKCPVCNQSLVYLF